MSRWLAKRLIKVPKVEPMTHLLSVYGIAGLTAYFGLLRDRAIRKPGETVVVSAAAGSVGIPRRADRQDQGLPRGRHRRRRSRSATGSSSELGFDAAVDYKAGPVFKALKEAAPKGIDVYFDNVGGDILEACLFQMNTGGRVSCCGAISAYDGAAPPAGPRGVPGLIVVKRLTLKGFIVTDFFAERDKAIADLQSWVAAGKLKIEEDVIDGLGEHAARAHRPAGRREPRQAHGQGGLSRSAVERLHALYPTGGSPATWLRCCRPCWCLPW